MRACIFDTEEVMEWRRTAQAELLIDEEVMQFNFLALTMIGCEECSVDRR